MVLRAHEKVSEFKCFIDFPPTPQERHRPRGRNQLGFYDPSAREKRTVRDLLIVEMRKQNLMEYPLFFSPLELVIQFYVLKPKSCGKRPYPSVKPDLSNYLKLIEDAANEVLYKDDALICKTQMEKTYTKEKPGIELILRLL